MSTAAYSIHIEALRLQDPVYLKGKPREVSEANNRNAIARVYTDYIRQFSLDWGNNRSAQNHHNEEGRAL